MTGRELLLFAAIAAGGYWLGRRGAPTGRPGSNRAGSGGARPWAAVVVGTLAVLLVLAWLAPGPGLFGPEGFLGGEHELFGPGGLFHDPPGPAR